VRSFDNQLDLFRDDPRLAASQWRTAAEKSLEQFPKDLARHRYYLNQAEELEKQCTPTLPD